jgi:hypothetical protein
MKFKFIILILTVLTIFSTACDKKSTVIKSSDYNIVVDGARYRLIKESTIDSEGRQFVAIYEKEGETRCYYTWNITRKSMITLSK